MAFNFDKYKTNNPLLQETNDDPTVSNVDAYAETGGLEEGEYPRIEFEEAVRKALQAGIDKNTLHKIIDWS